MKTYVEISVEKKLPKGESAIWMQPIGDKLKRFREFSLPELMEEYTKFVRQYQIIRVYKTDKELTEEFLTKKGIL